MESRIKKLPDDVVAKIAAGEVITSPVNVIKELIENCLDAKSTLICVTIKDKGTFIKVKDNGCGFNKEDLSIACIRYTSSKLSSMNDFEKLSTYGFRGEALSSISQVADLSIITKKKSDLMGSHATYKDGKMISCKNVAANDGTIIIIQNLFENLSSRKFNLISTFNKEYSRIIEVVTSYAIHCNFCCFQLEKETSRPDVLSNITDSKIKLIESLLGSKKANDLLNISHENSKYEYSFEGLISNTNSMHNKYTFILFINNRLVDCSPLKIRIKDIYAEHLMKGCNPFIYLNLKIVQKNLDVNLHPSKREVRYLNEDLINEEIGYKITECLKNKSVNRSIKKMNNSFSNESFSQISNLSKPSDQTTVVKHGFKISPIVNNSVKILKNKPATKFDDLEKDEENFSSQQSNYEPKSKKAKLHAYQIVRNDGKSKKINQMFALQSFKERTDFSELNLLSVRELKKEEELAQDISLTASLRLITLVGVLDYRRILVQCENSLNILDFVEFSKPFFYQAFLKNFGNFRTITLNSNLHLIDLLQIYKEQEKLSEEFDVEKNTMSLVEHYEMLEDYFSLSIDDCGFLKTIPILVEGHQPNLNLLPLLIWNLTGINFNDEKTCFKMIGRAFADYYSRPLDNLDEQKTSVNNIFSRFKEQTFLSTELNIFIQKLADLTKLYKIFERC